MPSLPFALPPDDDFIPVQPPANHFLSTARPGAQNPEHPSETTHQDWLDGARPDTSTLAAADYDVSVRTGFLPPEEPICDLSFLGGNWDVYERHLTSANEQIRTLGVFRAVGRLSSEWVTGVENLPEVSIELLTTVPLLRRAHVVLAFISHLYHHSVYPSKRLLPRIVAVPFLAISTKLGLPPVLTYADTVLWNYRLIDPSLGLVSSNLEIVTTFTSTESEHAFFMLSLLCELVAHKILRLMSSAYDEAFFKDNLSFTRIANTLEEIKEHINTLEKIFDDAIKGPFQNNIKIDPQEFFWAIRPWFNGGDWELEGCAEDGGNLYVNWGGPNAGQSSLVHSLDVFLEVDHRPKGDNGSSEESARNNPTSVSSGGPPAPNSDATFMQRMLIYMPLPHRQFLNHLSDKKATPSLRELVMSSKQERLKEQYNATVQAMVQFRSAHFRLITMFIIIPSRSLPQDDSVLYEDVLSKKQAVDAVNALAKTGEDSGKVLKGTGGTDLVKFLKGCRTRTEETKLD